jgi:hypothetical protein
MEAHIKRLLPCLSIIPLAVVPGSREKENTIYKEAEEMRKTK